MSTVWTELRCDWCGAELVKEHIDRSAGEAYCPFCEGFTPLRSAGSGVPSVDPPEAPAPNREPQAPPDSTPDSGAMARRFSFTIREHNDGLEVRYTRSLNRLTMMLLGAIGVLEVVAAIALQSIRFYAVTSAMMVAYFLVVRLRNTTILRVTHRSISFRSVPFPWHPERTIEPDQLWVQPVLQTWVRPRAFNLMATDRRGHSVPVIRAGDSLRDMRWLEHRIEHHLTIINRPMPGEAEEQHDHHLA